MENSEKPGPLDGVRVLDLGHYIAIPILTRMMATSAPKSSRSRRHRMATLHGLLQSSKMVTAVVLSSTIAASRASVST
jgi:hypothetical protein